MLREVFVDLELSKLPVSFRIGRQQIVWGNTVAIRAVDSINALDLTWHFSQEAGILGKVGFSELRIEPGRYRGNQPFLLHPKHICRQWRNRRRRQTMR